MAKIAIIGSGVVGQATGKGFAKKGHHVAFCDIDHRKLDQLNCEGYDICPDSHTLLEFGADAFFFAISTPTVDRRIQLGFLEAAVSTFARGVLRPRSTVDWCTVVIRSTVPPLTIEDLLIPILEEDSGKKAGKEFGVCMNPEFLREDSNVEDFLKPWIIVIGELNQRSGQSIEDIYTFGGRPDCPIEHTTLAEAEFQKYAHNLFNALKISFFNDMRQVGNRLGVNSDRVFELVAKSAEASWNPVYGIRDFGPFGGSCLPKDTRAFLSWAREHRVNLPMLEATIEVNDLLIREAQ